MANNLDYGYIRYQWQGRYRLHTHTTPVKTALLQDGYTNVAAGDIVTGQGTATAYTLGWKTVFGNYIKSLFDNFYTDADALLFAEFYQWTGENQEPAFFEQANPDDLAVGWDGTGGVSAVGAANTRGLVTSITYTGFSDKPGIGKVRGRLRIPESIFGGVFTDRPPFTNNPMSGVIAVPLNALRVTVSNPELSGWIYLRGDGFPNRIVGLHSKHNDKYIREDRKRGDVSFG